MVAGGVDRDLLRPTVHRELVAGPDLLPIMHDILEPAATNVPRQTVSCTRGPAAISDQIALAWPETDSLLDEADRDSITRGVYGSLVEGMARHADAHGLDARRRRRDHTQRLLGEPGGLRHRARGIPDSRLGPIARIACLDVVTRELRRVGMYPLRLPAVRQWILSAS